MQHGTSEVASSDRGLLLETVYLDNGRSFRRFAPLVRLLPLTSSRWQEGPPVPGTKAAKREAARE